MKPKTTKTLAITGCLLLLSGSLVAQAQQRLLVTAYHGIDTYPLQTQVSGQAPSSQLDSVIDVILDVGSTVCFRVVNPHPVFYRYAATVEEHAAPAEPDVSPLAAALRALLGLKSPAEKKSTDTEKNGFRPNLFPPPQESPRNPYFPLTTYIDAVDSLAADLENARQLVQQSDAPTFDPDQTNSTRAFETTVGRLRKLPDTEGRFNDEDLPPHLNTLHAAAAQALKTADRAYPAQTKVIQFEEHREEDSLALTLHTNVQVGASNTASPEHFLSLLDAYRAYADALVAARNMLRATFYEATYTPQCTTLGSKPATVTLNITPDTTTQRLRKTGESVITVHVSPRRAWPRLELVPMAYAIHTSNRPVFSLKDGVVVETRGDEVVFRPGGMLLFNAWPLGSHRNGMVGIGLGFGLSAGATSPLVDFLLGTVVRYRDAFAIGAGAGWAQLSDGLRAPAQVGKMLPPDAGDLDDLITKRRQGALYLTFTLTGLNLPLFN